MTYQVILANYLRGLWSEAMVKKAAQAGAITQAQADEILRQAV